MQSEHQVGGRHVLALLSQGRRRPRAARAQAGSPGVRDAHTPCRASEGRVWTAAAPVLRHWVLSAFNFPRDWAVEQLRGHVFPGEASAHTVSLLCSVLPWPQGAGLGAGLGAGAVGATPPVSFLPIRALCCLRVVDAGNPLFPGFRLVFWLVREGG